MVWAPDGGKGHLQNWISGDSQTTAFQTYRKWIMEIEASNIDLNSFLEEKQAQALKSAQTGCKEPEAVGLRVR